MDGNVKILFSIYVCVPGILPLFHIRTEKNHKVDEAYHDVNQHLSTRDENL